MRGIDAAPAVRGRWRPVSRRARAARATGTVVVPTLDGHPRRTGLRRALSRRGSSRKRPVHPARKNGAPRLDPAVAAQLPGADQRVVRGYPRFGLTRTARALCCAATVWRPSRSAPLWLSRRMPSPQLRVSTSVAPSARPRPDRLIHAAMPSDASRPIAAVGVARYRARRGIVTHWRSAVASDAVISVEPGVVAHLVVCALGKLMALRRCGAAVTSASSSRAASSTADARARSHCQGPCQHSPCLADAQVDAGCRFSVTRRP